MVHRVLLGRKAEKAMREFSGPDSARIRKGLQVLEVDPVHPRVGADIKALKGTSRLFRIRIGPFRAIYGLHEDDVIVTDIFRKKRSYDP